MRRHELAAAAASIATIWGLGATLPIGVDRPGAIYVVSDIVYSAMLASYAVVGWLAARRAPRRRVVRGFAWLLASAGFVGAAGNALEDLLALSGAEYVYGIGFLGSVIGFAGLAIALLAARAGWLALAVAATLAGVVVMAGHGPPIVPLLWLGIAAWAIFAPATRRADSIA